MSTPRRTVDTDCLVAGQAGGAGTDERATGAEICACFDRVSQHTLLPSGRVAWHPMSSLHESPGAAPRIENLLSGEQLQANVRRKILDAHPA